MSFVRRLLLVALILSAATAWGQSSTNQPQIGYLYPSGGQQGTVVQITAGGQFLRGADEVYVSGEGVRASVVQYIRPLRNLQSEQRQLLQSRLKEVRLPWPPKEHRQKNAQPSPRSRSSKMLPRQQK